MWKIVMFLIASVSASLADDRTVSRGAWDGGSQSSATTVSASSVSAASAVAVSASSPQPSSPIVTSASSSSSVTIISSTPSPAAIVSTIPQVSIAQAAIAQVSQPRDPLAASGYYPPSRRERPPTSVGGEPEEASLKIPGSAKPTKYHYYPHNQHIYLLPECAVQQVCNAVYVRLNYTQPLCACPSRYREPCSASLDSDDHHTTELSTGSSGNVLTLVKTCEPVADMRLCRAPRDWSLLALQNIRTGKSHYLVICRCPDTSVLEGPMSHDQPTYASVPGIRVYGMMCVGKTSYEKSVEPSLILPNTNRRGRPLRTSRSYKAPRANYGVPFPWEKVYEIVQKGII